MKVAVFNLSRARRLPRQKIRRFILAASRRERPRFSETNVVIAGNRYLQNLNRRFFRKNRTTNVISFDLGTVCEIYVARPQARDEYELCYLILHGFLHALGYDHRRASDRALMDRKCRRYLEDG